MNRLRITLLALLACACNRGYFSGQLDLDRVNNGEAYVQEIDLPDGHMMIRVVMMIDAPPSRIFNLHRAVEDYPLWQDGFQSARVLSRNGDDIEAEFTLSPVAFTSLSPMHEHIHIDPAHLQTSFTGYENDWMRGNQIVVKLSPQADGKRTLVNFYFQGEIKLAGASFLRGTGESRFARTSINMRRVVMLPQFDVDASPPAPSTEGQRARPRVAVPAFTADGVPAETARTLTRVFAEEMMSKGNWEVSTPQEITALLNFNRQETLAGCVAEKCAADIGRAVGADRLVSGSIGKVGNQFVVSASLVKIPEGSVEKRVSRNAPDGALIDLVRAAADELGAPN